MATPWPAPSGKTTTRAPPPPATTTKANNAVQRHTFAAHTPEHTDFFHDHSLPLSPGGDEDTAIPRHVPVPSTSNKVVQHIAASSGDRDSTAKSESGATVILTPSSSSSSIPHLSSPSSPLRNFAVPEERRQGRGSYWLTSEPIGGDDNEDGDLSEVVRRRLEPSSSMSSSAEETLCGSSSLSSLSQKAKPGLEEGEDDSEDDNYEEDYHYRRRRDQRPHYMRTLCAIQSNAVNFFKRNTGLLLVTASQVFLSLMNVAVKKLNGIDPPVPTLEVRSFPFFFYNRQLSLCLLSPFTFLIHTIFAGLERFLSFEIGSITDLLSFHIHPFFLTGVGSPHSILFYIFFYCSSLLCEW